MADVRTRKSSFGARFTDVFTHGEANVDAKANLGVPKRCHVELAGLLQHESERQAPA